MDTGDQAKALLKDLQTPVTQKKGTRTDAPQLTVVSGKAKEQKKYADHIGKSLAAATCVLLASPHGLMAEPGDPGTWQVDTAILGYAEDGGRVQAAEPVISATRFGKDDGALNLKLIVDTLTGASPSGATPSDQIQTFTRPSGKGTYTVDADSAPLDDSFKDTRVAVSANWSKPLDRQWSYSVGIYGSNEYDYQSFGANAGLARYFNQKNTQINFGLSTSSDTVSPVGGAPVGFSRVAVPTMADFDTAFAATRGPDTDTKTLSEILLGLSQVINKRTIMQFNYSYSQANGYLTDPYKILSVIDDRNAATFGATARDANDIPIYIHERRPDTRVKHAFYWQTKYVFNNQDVVDASYRLMTDDWGITSHTLDLKYRFQFESSYLEPHFRYYQQNAADFYYRYLSLSNFESGLTNLDDASADYRLGEMTGITAGIKYGYKMASGNKVSARLEYYTQTNTGDDGFGQLEQYDLYPATNAVMFTLGYSF